MKRKLIIKSFKTSAKSRDNISKMIVVGYNTKVNGYYIEKIGHYSKFEDKYMYFLKLDRLAYWLNKGAFLKSRISWVAGIIGANKLRKKNAFKKIK